MKKTIIWLIFILIGIFFFLPIIPYYNCSLSLPPENPSVDWVGKSCEKNPGTAFRWSYLKIQKYIN